MGFVRSVLLKASRSQWLARQLRDRRFFQRAVRRFMPGETLDAALDAAAQFGKAGIGSVLTERGEQVTSRAEAAEVRDHYLSVLERIQRRKLPAHISVKLTHLGLDASREGCVQDVLKLAARAEQARSFLWIDMEESRYVDANYFQLAQRLLGEAARHRGKPVFGTHDVRLIERIREAAVKQRVDPSSYEFHMLYGIRAAEQRALASRGHGVRVLISYGGAWFAWYMRRLAERPANIWFVLRNVV